jgi:hypothetical protein
MPAEAAVVGVALPVPHWGPNASRWMVVAAAAALKDLVLDRERY